jgi:1-acyl-sn-glycerol-3-phosphate acyltransferase
MQHACARVWGLFILFVSRVRVRVEGLDYLDKSQGFVFMANHLSMFDHWSFLAKLPFQFRFAAKASLFKIPFLGWHLRRSGNIPVDRSNPRKTLDSFKAIGEKVQSGLSLVIYPEGARTWGDSMAPFKRGPFLLAKYAQAPIVPVTIIGAHRRLARGSMIIHPGTMEMIIHPPIPFADYKEMEIHELSDKVRQIIQKSYRQVSK